MGISSCFSLTHHWHLAYNQRPKDVDYKLRSNSCKLFAEAEGWCYARLSPRVRLGSQR